MCGLPQHGGLAPQLSAASGGVIGAASNLPKAKLYMSYFFLEVKLFSASANGGQHPDLEL